MAARMAALRMATAGCRSTLTSLTSKSMRLAQWIATSTVDRIFTPSVPVPCQMSKHSAASVYSVFHRGCQYTLQHRIFVADNSGPISPFHDIPLYANNEKTVCNMVVEIPRWTNAKMETPVETSAVIGAQICKEERLNPIKQDVSKGLPRFTENIFPYHGYIWNYGALPQTFEDPEHRDKFTKMKGDNDPIDAFDIGSKVHCCGEVIQVKVLGVFALIDEGETDWKLIVIDTSDPLSSKLNDVCDVEAHMPGLLQASHDWLKGYKLPKGKPENTIAFDGEPKDRKFALEMIALTHEQWSRLIDSKQTSSIERSNMTRKGNPHVISSSAAKSILDSQPPAGKPATIPSEVEKSHFVRLSTPKSLRMCH